MTRMIASVGIAAAALLPALAHAQSNVTVYGVADVFVEYGEAGTKAASVHQKRVESGGANGSRLGLRSTEDLGDGLKANMVIEHGLLLDSGKQASTGPFWNRQAFVGLSNPYGAITAGRQYTPLLTHQDNFDTSLSTTGYGSPYNSGVMRTVSRVDNSVMVSAPQAVLGVNAALMAAAGEGSTGSTWSASVRRSDGALSVGAAYLLARKLNDTQDDKSIWNVAVSYKIGDALVAAAVQHTRNDSQKLATADDRREFFVGATYALGNSELRAAYGQGKVVDVDETTARHWSLGYVYNLSKRTALYTAVQEVINPDNLAYRTAGFTYDAIASGIPAGAGVTARAVAVGVRHRF